MDENLVTDYDAFAERYARHTSRNLFNAGYERPAILSAIGSVAGERVLDVGCASGELMLALLERAAREVVGLDASRALLAYAAAQTARFADRARTVQADLRESLPPLGDFDLVVCSLVLPYLTDWERLFSRFHAMLKPGGRLIFSTHHPEMTAHRVANYFDVILVDDVWMIDGVPTTVHFYHRPLEAIVAPLLAAGFAITAIKEPHLVAVPPRDQEPDNVRLATTPVFLIVSARG